MSAPAPKTRVEVELGSARDHAPNTGSAALHGAVGEADVSAWLVEETWSGFVHYVHRDFDHRAWRAECASLDRLPYVWVATGRGGAVLTRRKATIPFITKDIDDARRFSTKTDAQDWLIEQRLGGTDQFQAREHMWPAPSEAASPADASLKAPDEPNPPQPRKT